MASTVERSGPAPPIRTAVHVRMVAVGRASTLDFAKQVGTGWPMTEPDGARTRSRLPLSQLVTLSIYWFGIVIDLGRAEHTIILPAMLGDLPGDRRSSAPARDHRDRRRDRADPHPADGRHDQRLHGHPLGPSQAVHRHRGAARRRLPDRDRVQQTYLVARGVLLPAPAELELRPGAVPGLRPRPRPRRSRSGRPAG